MSKTNCPNCGAALDIFKSKCEFCGTKNVNLTDIDLSGSDPVNFIFKLPYNIIANHDMYLSILAIPELTNLTMESSPVSVYGGWNQSPLAVYHNTELNLGLNLRAVTRKVQEKDTLCTLSYRDQN